MISIKVGAKIEGLRPEILLGLAILERVLDSHQYDTTITEGTGGKHMDNSLHYKGLALDIRSKHILFPDTKRLIIDEARINLGNNFDLIIEDEDSPNQHYHLEYQPK